MITRLVFVLLVSKMCTEGSPLTKSKKELRIVGGVEAFPQHSLPYQVGLLINSGSFCGGVLISSQHVLTAAHCVYKSSSIEVILGAHRLDYIEDTQKIFYNPVVIIHSNYTTMVNDIALLKLPYRVELTSAIKPIRYLADDDSGDYEGCTALVSGWGHTSYSSPYIETRLRKVYLDIISNKECNSYFPLQEAKSQICTCGYDNMAGSVGACFGDSGGPLVVANTLVGLVSFGDDTCVAGYPTVYTRISYYRNWIAKYSGV